MVKWQGKKKNVKCPVFLFIHLSIYPFIHFPGYLSCRVGFAHRHYSQTQRNDQWQRQHTKNRYHAVATPWRQNSMLFANNMSCASSAVKIAAPGGMFHAICAPNVVHSIGNGLSPQVKANSFLGQPQCNRCSHLLPRIFPTAQW